MFSSRVPGDLQPNRLAVAVARARSDGQPLIDLTVTNPTAVGIDYPASILAGLASPDARHYQPRPFGLLAAREAVASDYRRRGLDIDPQRIVLTASTSEGYSLLFKLLCEPSGDAVMVPVPSYPLFDHLTRLDGVRAITYPLEYHGWWNIDLAALDLAWTSDVRAVLAVSPNNPTGSLVSNGDFGAVVQRCAQRNAALILDEVFSDYSLDPATREGGTVILEDALVFRLGGLSKSAGLPQVKLGWIAVDGPAALVAGALERLELICDTYLSVSTPVQVAAPALIAAGASIRAELTARVRENCVTLHQLGAAHPAVRVLQADAGWSGVVRVPATRSEEEMVLTLLQQDGVLVHPGFFFDFEAEAFLVVSLLPDPAAFRQGVQRMMERVDV